MGSWIAAPRAFWRWPNGPARPAESRNKEKRAKSIQKGHKKSQKSCISLHFLWIETRKQGVDILIYIFSYAWSSQVPRSPGQLAVAQRLEVDALEARRFKTWNS